MVKDVKTWRDQWYEGVKMRPEPDELEDEMNDLGRSIWGVCYFKGGLLGRGMDGVCGISFGWEWNGKLVILRYY